MSTQELFIVDDNADHRYLLRQVFINYLPQYKVTVLEGGFELFKALEDQVKLGAEGNLPCAIILDYHMPFYDGLTILKILKKKPERNLMVANIPIIMMSNGGTEKQVSDCYDAGASAFLKKPLDFITMKDLLVVTADFWVGVNRIPRLKPVITD